MSNYLPLIFLWLVIILILFQNKKSRRRRRIRPNKERISAMNELITNFIGKRCQIQGDLNIATLATIKEVKDGWILIEGDKGKQTLLNITYISQIQEYPEKQKKQKA